MAWTVNFKACKRCSSGEYWLVSSGFTNTVHPVAAGSRTRVWICTHSCMAWSPREGGEGFPKSCLPGKNRGQQTKGDDLLAGGLLPVLWLPFQQRGLLQRSARSLRFGLRCFASCTQLLPSRCCRHARMHVSRVAQVGLDCEGNSQCHELPRCVSSMASQHLVAVFIQVL